MDSQKRKSRRSRRGGGALSPTTLGGRRSRRTRRGGNVSTPLAPYMWNVDGEGITSPGALSNVQSAALTASGGGYRRKSRRSRRSRRDRR